MSAPGNPISGYAVGVLLPSGIVALPYLYTEGLGPVIAFFCAFFLLSLSALFIGHVRRVARLKATHMAMPTYEGAYVLLLRSFGRTEGYRTTVRDPGPDGLIEGEREHSEIGDLEAIVRTRGLRLVALGGDFLLPADHGLFWLTTRDEDWERNFQQLARGAAAILICPETTEGIRREIVLLKGWKLLGKSVFFMAKTPKAEHWLVAAFNQYDEPEARAERWELHREEFRAEGIELPDYDEQGLFFTLGDDLQVARTAPVQTDFDFLNLLPSPLVQPSSFSEVFSELALDRPIYEKVNWLHPPGADRSLVHGSLVLGTWALLANGFLVALILYAIYYA